MRSRSSGRSPLKRVGGLDGCVGGWVLVTASSEEWGETEVQVVADLAMVWTMLEGGQLAALGIDMPIGLAESHPRPCDVEVRRRLGPRSSSVFPAPARAVLAATSYREACDLSAAACGKRLSRQLFNILPKIVALDLLITPQVQERVFEVHPELSFSAMAGRPMSHYKRTREGRDQRLALLRKEFVDVDARLSARPRRCAVDDVLDAYAVAWTARRWLAGESVRLGGELDSRGLRMEVIA